MGLPRVITLIEYQPVRLPAAALSEQTAEYLWRNFAAQIEVRPPSFLNHHQWELTAQGWIGHIPVTPDLYLTLQPKVPLATLFGMLEWAYAAAWRQLPGLARVSSLAELYARLALALAEQVLERERRGLWRAYVSRQERLPYVRGRLDAPALARQPVSAQWPGRYEAFSADLAHNRIPLWTLHLLLRSGLGSAEIQTQLQRAYQGLRGAVTPIPCTAHECLALTYTRLNEDYRPIHALCRFFLDQAGPSHHLGDLAMLPFLIDMDRLYETFVAAWLQRRLPPHLLLQRQEPLTSRSGAIQMRVDLVLRDRTSGAVQYVLDTKYKAAGKPAAADLQQVAFYAQAYGCREAVLVYPTPLTNPLDDTLNQVRLRTLTFRLDQDLDQAGQAWLQTLLEKK